MTSTITVPVHMTPKVFRHFAYHDTFRVHKNLKNPLIFALLMIAFAAVCFIFRDRAAQAVLLGGVLLGVGLLLPFAYWLMFELSVRQQIKKMALAKSPLVYTLALGSRQNGITVTGTHGEPPVHLDWAKLYRIIRAKDCFYLYATPQKAFLIPNEQVPLSPDEFARFLHDRIA